MPSLDEEYCGKMYGKIVYRTDRNMVQIKPRRQPGFLITQIEPGFVMVTDLAGRDRMPKLWWRRYRLELENARAELKERRAVKAIANAKMRSM
ncbi:MAG: hypothetical protein C5B60_10260 [Chloroflexi bacterium]|nr:MAG: hypothetical protein C5B60_10260 [Chloroflexota bacterium]